MKKYWELDKDPSEYFREYVKVFGEEQYQREVPYLLWDIESIATDVKDALERNITLSEAFPDRYPIEIEEGDIV